jgi:hypothetical protein
MTRLHCRLQEVNGRTDPTYELPINSGPMTINTSMFEGKVEVHLKGLPTSQKRVFEGKKRFFQIMCQVCLQRQCCCCFWSASMIKTGTTTSKYTSTTRPMLVLQPLLFLSVSQVN